ncbi:MAG: hypothetical protein OQK57_02485 [Ignavibacteriaceae bacterium]|nr:hypothetical protein [Ignavibacteriaceae bacterium]
MKRGILILFSVVLTQVAFYNCSDRFETPTIEKDSTIVYPPKSTNGILAEIIFCNKISSKTGKPIGDGTVSLIKQKAKLYAVIELQNRAMHISRDLMFHIDWIDSSGNSFYKKRVDLSPSDSTSRITSSISLSPPKRRVGNYFVRVYFFRELIAEKKFQLVDLKTDLSTIKKKNIDEIKEKPVIKVKDKKTLKPKVKAENINANIILCRKVNKKTGKAIGTDTTFTIKDKAKVKAVVSIEHPNIKTNRQMKFYFDWIGPDKKSFYKKKIEFLPNDSASTISSSISISPKKRKPGTYTVRVSFRKKVIAEQKFVLTMTTKPESI